jgi:ATP-dependent helicase/nuclease subunit B
LSRFTQKHPKSLPTDIAGELMRIADEIVREMTGVPRVAAFWLPRLERFAQWFAETEMERRKRSEMVVAEVTGKLVLDKEGRPFALTARADRIDLADGVAIITDYKTGAPPPPKAVLESRSPQLSLEAAMLMAGVFEQVPAQPVAKLRYIRASGGEPPGEEKDVTPKPGEISVSDLAAKALEGATRLVSRFDDPQQPYEATRRPHFNYDYDDYAHLARVAEWSGSGGDESGGGDA